MLRVPATITFLNLHEILQTAFAWTNSHARSFSIHTIANALSKKEAR